jgi:hypothetical protein
MRLKFISSIPSEKVSSRMSFHRLQTERNLMDSSEISTKMRNNNPNNLFTSRNISFNTSDGTASISIGGFFFSELFPENSATKREWTINVDHHWYFFHSFLCIYYSFKKINWTQTSLRPIPNIFSYVSIKSQEKPLRQSMRRTHNSKNRHLRDAKQPHRGMSCQTTRSMHIKLFYFTFRLHKKIM